MKFSVSHLRDASFAPRGLRSFFEYRDLGIKGGTKGDYVAHLVRHNGCLLYTSPSPRD